MEKRSDSQTSLKTGLAVYFQRRDMMNRLLDELNELLKQDAIIVVEGKRDIAALNSLGLKGDFYPATHYSLINFCEDLAHTGRKIVIMTDWDRRGNLLASKIVHNLQSLGVTPDTRIRDLIISLVQKEIKDVESLPGYVDKLRNITRSDSNDYGLI